MASLPYQCFLLKKFINNYKWTVLAQYFVWLNATNLQKSMKKCQSSQLSSGWQGKDLSCLFVSGKLLHRFPKYILRKGFRLSLVFNLLLIFHEISGSCSYKIVLIKRKECILYRKMYYADANYVEMFVSYILFPLQ